MKLTIERANALAAMARVAAVIPDKHTVPMITNVLIEAFADGTVSFRGTNLDIFVTTMADAMVQTPGAITVPADMFNQILRRSPEGAELTLETVEAPARLNIRCGRSRWALPTLPATNYTAKHDPVWGATFDISGSQLTDMLERPRFAARPANEIAQPFLAGVYLTVHGDEMHAVAMNGRTIAFMKADRPVGWLEDFGVILPHPLIDAMVAAMAPEKAKDIRLNISETAGGVIAGRTIISGRAKDGPFMKYLQIMERYETTATHQVTVAIEPLKAALLRVALVCAAKDRMAKLTLDDGSISIVAKGESTEGGDQVNCKLEGEKTALGFPVDRLIGALDALAGDVAVLRYPMDGEGVNLTTPDDPDTRLFVGQCRI